MQKMEFAEVTDLEGSDVPGLWCGVPKSLVQGCFPEGCAVLGLLPTHPHIRIWASFHGDLARDVFEMCQTNPPGVFSRHLLHPKVCRVCKPPVPAGPTNLGSSSF